MTIRPIICINHAAFDAARRESFARLYAELQPQCLAAGVELFTHHDTAGKGSAAPWVHVLEYACSRDATHVTFLPDDVFLVPHFVEVLHALIKERPTAIMCGLSNHPQAPEIYKRGDRWYSTTDGYTGFAGTMPIELAREHLGWRKSHLQDEACAGDLAVNLWAQETGRLVWKMLPSIVQHDLSVPSVDGNTWQDTHPDAKVLRESQVWEPTVDLRGRSWGGAVANVGRTFRASHWGLATKVKPEKWQLERMYVAHHGPILRDHVIIAAPCYRESEEILRRTRPSRAAAAEYLAANGVECSVWETPGDSHVDRMRQRATHHVLKMGATHLLWWDADIEAVDPTCILQMLRTGHDVIAGAYPFKDESGRVVCNLWPETEEELTRGGEVRLPGGCIEVRDAGTGFMLVSRRALLSLMHKHPERMHLSLSHADRGEPLWALWDAEVHKRVLLTEDYNFCRLWQESGGKVYVYVPATFRHYGIHGYGASFVEQFGMQAVT